MPLPFKERPSLPDNKQLATVRLNHLLKGGKHKEHYVRFMEEVIERGDAEEVFWIDSKVVLGYINNEA